MTPRAKTKAARGQIAGAFAEAFAADFKENGKAAIAKLRDKDPAAYLRLAAAIEPPSETEEPFAELSDEEIAQYRELLDRLLKTEAEDPNLTE